ncbi:hypothetical protein [Escherichia phage Lidtsur]|uniref:Uncharacterized protein n=1 Tax=Escherichia phage Lidtsur TaxID=2562235 RepID=A0A4D6DYR4_9CAUD|nr:hypothetical protein HOV34_gp13 [Escherichia phage Lidtsur]QBZ71517.1 hypothetical protein [Escherichia phage Lidtsur]
MKVSRGFLFVLLVLATLYVSTCTMALAATMEKVHLDAYDVPLGAPDGQVYSACVIDLHQGGTISTLAYVGECEAVLPHLKEKLEGDGTTTIVTLSINGHNINLT